MTEMGTDWRAVDGVASAWFDAPSSSAGAALAGRIVEIVGELVIDVRAAGIRVRLDSEQRAEAVSAAARDLGLKANPAALQQLSVVLESSNQASIASFWRRVLDYAPGDDGRLSDPLRRDPAVRVQPTIERRPLRNRIHLDVVRPSAVVEQLNLGEGFGPYEVCHADPDGNEVDLVPGDPLGDGAATADWRAVFSAVACYRTVSPTQQRDVVAAAAALADAAGFPLLIDLRPGLVLFDSGKDQWDADAHGLQADFGDLAASIQAAARELGATADSVLPRFVQLFFDAADVAAVQAFWVAALEYVHDPRTGITDIYDPRRLNPVLVFQELAVDDVERRQQRNRIHFQLALPSDVAQERVAAMVAVGGRLLGQSNGRTRVADPEGNELEILSST